MASSDYRFHVRPVTEQSEPSMVMQVSSTAAPAEIPLAALRPGELSLCECLR